MKSRGKADNQARQAGDVAVLLKQDPKALSAIELAKKFPVKTTPPVTATLRGWTKNSHSSSTG